MNRFVSAAVVAALLFGANGVAQSTSQSGGQQQPKPATPSKPPASPGKAEPRDVIGRTIFVIYDHAQGALSCDGVVVANRVCQLRGSEGDVISVSVHSALPGLFQYTVAAVQGTSPELPRQVAQSFGLIQTQTATTPAAGTATTPPVTPPAPAASNANIQSLLSRFGMSASVANVNAFKSIVGEKIDVSEVEEFAERRNISVSPDDIRTALRDIAPAPPPPDVQHAYNELLAASDAARLTMFNLGGYTSAVQTLRDKRRLLLDRLGVADDPNEVAKATAARIKDEGFTPPAESAVAEEWRRLTLALRDAAPQFTIVGPQLFSIGDRDLTITIDITPKSDYFGGPSQKAVILAGLTQPWRISTTTGFVVSSLLDDSYSIKQVTDSGTTPVTRNTALREKQDTFRPPEAAFLLHITPGWGGIWDRFSGSFGLGITTGAAGRAYLGATYRLGAVAAITAGAVGGRVKRLGNEVDPNNLGTVIPNDKLRDVYRTGWMVGISWRIAQ